MVENDVLVVTAPDGIRAVGKVAARIEVAQAETHIADDHVVGVDHDRPAGDADAAARGGLPRNGEVVVPDAQVARQVDRAGHVEDDDAFARGLDSGAERSGARVVEVGDAVDPAAAAARRVHAAALGAGESAQHAVVLVGQGKPQVHVRIGRPFRREGRKIGERRVLPPGGTERSRGKHAETVGNARFHFETLRLQTRRGRLQGRRSVAGIEFEGEAHGLDRLGDAPAHRGRAVRNRHGDIRHGKGFHVGNRRRGIVAATDGESQHPG